MLLIIFVAHKASFVLIMANLTILSANAKGVSFIKNYDK